jgi:hypothetical protein
MIIGAHAVITSTNADADRAFLRDVLNLSSVDDGGYIILGLPPAEMSVHPSDANDVHQFHLMCADVKAFVADMAKRGVVCGAVDDQGWGLITQLMLPGGGKLPVYQPRHKRPKTMTARPPKRKPAKAAKAKPRRRLRAVKRSR